MIQEVQTYQLCLVEVEEPLYTRLDWQDEKVGQKRHQGQSAKGVQNDRGREARAFGLGLLAAHQVEGVELFPKQDQIADGPGSLIRMPFGVHRLTGRRYGFYTADGSPLASSIREQIYALGAPETVPEAAFEAYRYLCRLGRQPHLQSRWRHPQAWFQKRSRPAVLH